MHVLFLAPDTNVYNHRFVEALKREGCTVCALGYAPVTSLSPAARRLLDRYESVSNVFDQNQVLEAAKRVLAGRSADRIETIDEPLIEPAAWLRQALSLPGMTPQQAKLCRDKQAMKEFMRQHGIPCAASTAAATAHDVELFVEREGFPIVIKPREGFGTLSTYRINDRAELSSVLGRLKNTAHAASWIVEEFVDGHEGFYDTVTGEQGVVHDFIAHYYPSCLQALQDRRIRPQIACTNRVDSEGYRELRQVGARLISALGLNRTATHMEWFFGSKGLKIGEIGARPAGERIWDMHAIGNQFDLYGDWARTILHGKPNGKPQRTYAVGSVQIRPDRDGIYRGHRGLEVVQREFHSFIVESEVPEPGSRTQPLEKGWHVNTWFRAKHEDYDRLREILTTIGSQVTALAG
jgi:hypothetical protein